MVIVTGAFGFQLVPLTVTIVPIGPVAGVKVNVGESTVNDPVLETLPTVTTTIVAPAFTAGTLQLAVSMPVSFVLIVTPWVAAVLPNVIVPELWFAGKPPPVMMTVSFILPLAGLTLSTNGLTVNTVDVRAVAPTVGGCPVAVMA